MGNGLKKNSRSIDLFQLEQIGGNNDDYDNERHESTDYLMDIKGRKTNSVSFFRPLQKSDLSSEEGSESGFDNKSKTKRKGETKSAANETQERLG